MTAPILLLGGAKVRFETGAVPVRRCADAESAAEILATLEPRCLVLDSAHADNGALGLVAESERRGYRAPVLVVTSAGWAARPFVPWSPYLAAVRPPADWLAVDACYRRTLARSGCRAPDFTLADYLQLGKLLGSSVDLHLRLPGGEEALAELVGGDLWSVFTGKEDGETGLARILQIEGAKKEVFPLRALPAKRQLNDGFAEILTRAAQARVPAFKTLPLEAVPAAQRTALPALPATTVRQPRHDISGFEALFSEGLRAALASDVEVAIRLFERAQELEPQDLRVRCNLERLRQARG